jgi:hypothetical protein
MYSIVPDTALEGPWLDGGDRLLYRRRGGEYPRYPKDPESVALLLFLSCFTRQHFGFHEFPIPLWVNFQLKQSACFRVP